MKALNLNKLIYVSLICCFSLLFLFVQPVSAKEKGLTLVSVKVNSPIILDNSQINHIYHKGAIKLIFK